MPPSRIPAALVCEACGTPWPCGWDSNGEAWGRHRPCSSHDLPIAYGRILIDLTGSRLGPGWKSVDAKVRFLDAPEMREAIRRMAAAHYVVPLEQVGPVRDASPEDDDD